MPQVHIPPSLRPSTGGQKQFRIEGQNVRQVVESIDRLHPGFRDRIVADGQLKPGIAVAVGSRVSDLGLLERLSDGDEVHLVMSVSGG